MISRGVKLVKNVGVIIDFDDVEYSDEERDLLWGRFIMLLVDAAENKKEKKNAKCFNIPKHAQQTKQAKIVC